MSRILILFASHYGQTRKIAKRIDERLSTYHHEVEIADAGVGLKCLPPPDDYDAVVLGSRIELGRHAREICDYMRVHRAALKDRPTAVFSVSMAASAPDAGIDPQGYLAKLFADVAWRPTRSVAFAGGLPYRKYGWLLRQVMHLISRKAGHSTDTSRDHELTIWSRVDAFADTIAELVPDHVRAVSHV